MEILYNTVEEKHKTTLKDSIEELKALSSELKSETGEINGLLFGGSNNKAKDLSECPTLSCLEEDLGFLVKSLKETLDVLINIHNRII